MPVAPKRGPEAKLFGQVTALTCLILIALVTCVQWARLITRKRPGKVLAAVRYLSYTKIPVIGLAVSHATAMLSVFIPLMVYLLTAEQYYREGKWSPLGLRAGYIAAGLFPFIFSFGSRINPFIWISRIPHERWMMYHQWGARAIFLFSMIHTGTMLHSKWDTIGELWQKEAVTSQYFTEEARLANGTVAIVLMAWIVFSSFANFRKLSYEFFVIQHIITVMGLLVSLVAHLQVDLKQGVKYFYASAAVWGFSILVRATITLLSLVGVGRFKGVATIKEMPGGVTRVDIETTGKHAWQAGQHVYLRLTKLNPFQSHPFTIASTANPDHQHHILSLRVKTRDGITRQLAKRAGRDGTTAVIVEGPYGGLEERLTGFDDVLLIAGGVGGTFVWPIAEHLTRLNRPFRMVWSVKSQEASTWFIGSDVDLKNVQLHVTEHTSESKSPDSPGEKDEEPNPNSTEKSSGHILRRAHGRPDVPRLIREFGRDASARSRVAVISCGPDSLVSQVGEGCKEVQWSIATGKYDLAEMWLHRETFSW